jgi:hypothetical protein
MEPKDLSLATANVPLKIMPTMAFNWSSEMICKDDMKLDVPVANRRQGSTRYDPSESRLEMEGTQKPEGPDLGGPTKMIFP